MWSGDRPEQESLGFETIPLRHGSHLHPDDRFTGELLVGIGIGISINARLTFACAGCRFHREGYDATFLDIALYRRCT